MVKFLWAGTCLDHTWDVLLSMMCCHHCPPQRAKVLNCGLEWRYLTAPEIHNSRFFSGGLNITSPMPAGAGLCVPHPVILPLALHLSAYWFPQFRILIQIFLFADAEQGLCYALLPFASVTEHVRVMFASLC